MNDHQVGANLQEQWVAASTDRMNTSRNKALLSSPLTQKVHSKSA